jgi:hypothetical protein
MADEAYPKQSRRTLGLLPPFVRESAILQTASQTTADIAVSTVAKQMDERHAFSLVSPP